MSITMDKFPLGTKFIPSSLNSSEQKKYSTIIFDIGGVLLEWKPLTLAEQLFPSTQAASIMKLLTESPLWSEFDRGTIKINQLSDFASANGFEKKLTEEILDLLPHHLPPLPNTINILKKVKALGYKTYVLSNMPRSFFPTLLATHDFFSLFDGMVASYTINHIKPEPEIYNHLLEKFRINPQQALFIDDLEANILGGNMVLIDGIVSKDSQELAELTHTLGIIPQKFVQK